MNKIWIGIICRCNQV